MCGELVPSSPPGSCCVCVCGGGTGPGRAPVQSVLLWFFPPEHSRESADLKSSVVDGHQTFEDEGPTCVLCRFTLLLSADETPVCSSLSVGDNPLLSIPTSPHTHRLPARARFSACTSAFSGSVSANYQPAAPQFLFDSN